MNESIQFVSAFSDNGQPKINYFCIQICPPAPLSLWRKRIRDELWKLPHNWMYTGEYWVQLTIGVSPYDESPMYTFLPEFVIRVGKGWLQSSLTDEEWVTFATERLSQ